MNWQVRDSGVQDDLEDITFAEGRFVIVGKNGVILTSVDGLAFSPRESGTDANLYAVHNGDGLFVAVGHNGKIINSDDGLSWY